MKKKIFTSFAIVIILLILVSFYAATTGSISVSVTELIQGLINGNNEKVDIVKDLRFPRIIVALFTGAALAVSGVLFQAVMKNPLAEAGIIGISAGGRFAYILVISIAPTLFFWSPLIACIGSGIACFLVYLLSWKTNLSPIRLILVGVAINATFTGFNQSFTYFFGYSTLTHASISTLSLKTWNDVEVIALYASIGLIISLFLSVWCNVLALQDKTVQNLGFNLVKIRVIVSAVAVLLAAVTTAIAGVISFVGLLVPHISRLIVGTDHKVLIPFSSLAGALLILAADTLGRIIIPSEEIPASIIMAIIGGPFLIYLIRKSDRVYGS